MEKLPDITRDFVKSVAPGPAQSPLAELQKRFAAKQQAARPPSNAEIVHQNSGSHGSGHSIEYMVEMRIREWMMREQREREEAQRRLNHPPPKP